MIRSYAGHRILSDEAPHLPISGCSKGGQCDCVYKHWPDRRQEPRRATDFGMAGLPYYGPERREDQERRSERMRLQG